MALSTNTSFSKILYTVLLQIVALAFINSQGIDFSKKEWKEALEEAKEQNKLVFVDAYAVWCGPCKRMAKTTFVDESVGKFFNENFINLKIDMEKGSGREFSRQYGVSSYPTLFFLDGEGEIVNKTVGAKDVPKLMAFAKESIKNFDSTAELAKEYEKGNRDYDLVLSYVRELNKKGETSLKIANDYLRSSPEISEFQEALFVYEAVTEADSRLFDMMLERRDVLLKNYSIQEIDSKILKASEMTRDKAIEFESLSLLNEAILKSKNMESLDPSEFEWDAKLQYYYQTGDHKNYFETADYYISKIIKENPNKLNEIGSDIAENFSKNPDALKIAEKACKRCVKLAKNEAAYKLTYANVLELSGDYKGALSLAYEALEITKSSEGNTAIIEKYIETLQTN